MTITERPTANAVMAAIDARRPGLKLPKKHSLLFFAQGHHLAHFGVPLFDNLIIATDRGVRVAAAPGTSTVQPIKGEGALNTIGYVVERYGALSPVDLGVLVRDSRPWRVTDESGPNRPINLVLLTEWFRRADETDDPDDERPNRAERAAANELWSAEVARRG